MPLRCTGNADGTTCQRFERIGINTLGKYEILDEIGHGGFSTAYKARNPDLDQVVAVKVLHGGYTDWSDVVQLSPQNRTLG